MIRPAKTTEPVRGGRREADSGLIGGIGCVPMLKAGAVRFGPEPHIWARATIGCEDGREGGGEGEDEQGKRRRGERGDRSGPAIGWVGWGWG